MSNFFEYYHEYTKTSEPPANFQAWSAVAVISALLGKKCFIPQGRFTTYPNLFIVLVGEPATRKSTAMNIGKNLVKTVERVPLAPESSTREALIDKMAESKVECTLYGKDISYWQASAFISEFEQFLGGKHVNQAMVGFLTDIWDIPLFEEHTRKGGTITVHNPYFSLLGCCTPSWMNTKLQSDVISDGFSRRTIFVLEHELNTLNPWPVTSEHEEHMKKLLEAEAQRIFAIAGKFEFTPEARTMYDMRYYRMRDDAKTHSEKVRHYFSSKHILVQKVAMCLSAAYRNDRVIDEQILGLAFLFLDENDKRLDTVFAGVGRNELKPHLDKFIKFVEERRKVTAGDIVNAFSSDLGTREIEELIQMAVDLQKITTAVNPDSQMSYVALQAPAPLVVANLLLAASRIKVTVSADFVNASSSGEVPVLDQATRRLLDHQQQRRNDLQTGVLLRGTRSLPAQTQAPLSMSDLACTESDSAGVAQ